MAPQPQVDTQARPSDPTSSTPRTRPSHGWRRRASALGSLAAALLITLLAGILLARGPADEQTGAQPSRAGTPPLTAAALRGLDLRAVALVAPDEGWAVGGTVPDPTYDPLTFQTPYSLPVLLHYMRGRWYRVQAPADLSGSVRLEAVRMLSPTEGWAVGGSLFPPGADALPMGYLLHFHNGTWRVDTVLQNTRLTRLALLSPTDGWVVGDLDPLAGAAVVLHYDGTGWRRVTDPIFRGLTLTAVGGTSGGNVWVAGIREAGATGSDGQAAAVLLHFDGARWAEQAIHANTPPLGLWIADLAMASPTDGWAVGTVLEAAGPGGAADPSRPSSAIVLRYQSGSWTQVARYVAPAGAPTFALDAVVVTAEGDGWAVGTAGLRAHIRAGQVMPDAVPASIAAQPDLWGVAVSSSSDGWAVGDRGSLLYHASDGWHPYSP